MNTDFQSTIIFIMEIIGVIAFAASGAMVGIKKNMDIFGIAVLGVVTSVGGGIIRDLVLGINPPKVFNNPVYVIIALVTSCAFFIVLYIFRKKKPVNLKAIYDMAMLIMDTIGLGIFTVLGVKTGIQMGYENQEFLLIFVGTITGVGGGLLRDVMADIPPAIFVKHIYACASIAGAAVCAVLAHYLSLEQAMIIGFAVILIIRFLAAHFRWNLPRIQNDTE